MRLTALAICLVLGASGCNFAVKHPAVTAGIVVGSIGLATCSLSASIDAPDGGGFAKSPRAKCYGVVAVAGTLIALITAGALWLGYEDETAPAPGSRGPVADPTNLEPAPVFVPKQLPKPEPKPEPKQEPPKPEPAPEPAPDPAPTP